MEGVVQGLKKLYPDRHSDAGDELKSCTGSAGTVWGDGCDSIIEAYAAGLTEPCNSEETCNATDAIKCYPDNDNTQAAIIGTTNCDLVELEYGYSQW